MTSTKTLKRFNNIMAVLCTVLMIGIPFAMLWFWLNFESNIDSLPRSMLDVLQVDTIQGWQVFTVAFYSVIGAIVFAYGLLQLRRLFINFGSQEYFSHSSLKCMHRFCLVLFVSAVLKIFGIVVTSVALTWNNAPGERSLIFTFGSNEFWSLFIAATFLSIAWSFKEGSMLAKENAEFV